MFSFDYYQKAMYELFDLRIVKAELNDGGFVNEFYIDLDLPRRQIVYLRPHESDSEVVMLAKFGAEYQVIPDDFDYWLERPM